MLAYEGMIITNEVKSALDKMQIEKSPGSDGLTVQFCKTMSPIIGDTLADTLNHAFIEGEFPASQKMGIITLGQIKGKYLELIKNCRLVAPTNVGYKLLTKALAMRTEKNPSKTQTRSKWIC